MSKLLDNLNKEQQEAVTHVDGPLLIVAGAGTGKTTVLTRRVAYLVEQNLAGPQEILSLTFTEKAAAEMCERVELLLPLGNYDLWISTFHSFCERILKNHSLEIGLPTDFNLLNETRQWMLIYKNLEKFNLNYYRPIGNPSKFIDALLSHFSRCKDELITPEGYLEYAQSLRSILKSTENTKTKGLRAKKKLKNLPSTLPPAVALGSSKWRAGTPPPSEIDETEISRIEEVANAYNVYQKLLVENNALDFGDLINKTLELFQKRPKILNFYQNKFKFFMVDEFQDTNFAQAQLVSLLAGKKANLVVVGDDDQSIYKFRGASVSNILKFQEIYPQAKQVTLQENYRSTQEILDLAYNFIQKNNPDRLEPKLGINKKLKSNTKETGEIKVLESEDLSGELNMVAKKILNLKTSENSWNDFAVLIRSRAAADELLPVFTKTHIPFTFASNKGLYKKPIILDILAYLRLLNNAHESTYLYRVLTLPKFSLKYEDLSTVLQTSTKKALSLYESLNLGKTSVELSEEAKKKIKLLQEALSKHASLAKTSTALEMFVFLIADLGIEAKLKEETLENAENRELLDQFYKKIEEFEKENENKSLHSFLNNLNLELQSGEEGEIKFDPNLGPESLKIFTVHAAKGLEFRYVFIINLVEQRFPTREKKESIEIPSALVKDILPEGDFHLQEERRLFYVGLTRAKTHLYLSWAKDYGGVKTKKPSPFLVETHLVPSDHVSKATGKVVFSQTKNLPEVYKNLPTKFSFSQLSDFESCPLKYKYAYFLKLPLPGNAYFSFGSTMHKVFEEFLKIYKNNQALVQVDLFGKKPSDQPLPEFKILEQFYSKYWIDDWYASKKQKEDYRLSGTKMLKTFYDHLSSNPAKPKHIEKFFKLKLGTYDFVGKIDRADETPQGLEILDYKTGKVPKTKKDLDQLYIYQLAAQEHLGEKVSGLKYWYLQENKFVEEELATTPELNELKEKLLTTIEKIVYVVKHDLFLEEHKKLKNHECDFIHFE